jgi:hypothetical protein
MLDSSPRIPRSSPVRELEWEETTFTRPMRSPFAAKDEAETPPAPSVDVALEEAALFEPPPIPALRRVSTAPPPRRKPGAPPFQEEDTVKREQPNWLLRVLASERDSTRLRAAASSAPATDLSKTLEEPTFGAEIAKLRTR